MNRTESVHFRKYLNIHKSLYKFKVLVYTWQLPGQLSWSVKWGRNSKKEDET